MSQHRRIVPYLFYGGKALFWGEMGGPSESRNPPRPANGRRRTMDAIEPDAIEGHAIDGGCTCGAVRYRMHGPPMFVHCCHCTKCQTETGSAFAINALIEAERLETLAGAPE